MKSTPEMQCHAQYRCPSLKLSTDINYCQFKNTIHKINILLFCSRQQWRYNWTTDIRSNSLVELLWTLMQPTPLPTYVHDWWWLDRVLGWSFSNLLSRWLWTCACWGHSRLLLSLSTWILVRMRWSKLCKVWLPRISHYCTRICFRRPLGQVLGRSISDLCKWQELRYSDQFWGWYHALLYTRGYLDCSRRRKYRKTTLPWISTPSSLWSIWWMRPGSLQDLEVLRLHACRTANPLSNSYLSCVLNLIHMHPFISLQ